MKVDTISPALGAITTSTEYTALTDFSSGSAQPEVKVKVNGAITYQVNTNISGVRKSAEIVDIYGTPAELSKGVASGSNANVTLTIYTKMATTVNDEFVVEYTLNGAPKTETLSASAGSSSVVNLAASESVSGKTDIVVTSVSLKRAVDITTFTPTTNVTAGSIVVKMADGTVVNDNDAVTVGTVLTVEFTASTVVSATTVSMNGGTPQSVSLSGDKVIFTYTVVDGSNTISVTAAS